jgi:hypothetical protein
VLPGLEAELIKNKAGYRVSPAVASANASNEKKQAARLFFYVAPLGRH